VLEEVSNDARGRKKKGNKEEYTKKEKKMEACVII